MATEVDSMPSFQIIHLEWRNSDTFGVQFQKRVLQSPKVILFDLHHQVGSRRNSAAPYHTQACPPMSNAFT
jgi:hypothetical protein